MARNALTRKQWAARINKAWQSSVEGIFKTGRDLIAAAAQLDRAEFVAMCKTDLRFGSATASKLAQIADNKQLTKLSHGKVLPLSWTTLYALSQLPDDVLAEKLKDGTVNSEMERSDVQLLLNRINRAERFKHMAAPALPDDPVHVLYADPPWEFEVWEESSAYGAALEHYPTMPLDEICALPISECATDDAVLFMWATAPTLQEAFKVIEAWGFKYKTGMAWDKEIPGMGYYVRNQHEHLLIATRGSMPLPDPANKPASMIHAKRGKHSAKPHSVYDDIERMYPGLRKREFFARHWRRGWEKPWGNIVLEEVTDDETAVS